MARATSTSSRIARAYIQVPVQGRQDGVIALS
jgi:hypothetical protein